LKKSNTKKAGQVDQVVEHLLSKHEALSSNPNTIKKNKKQKQNKKTSPFAIPQDFTNSLIVHQTLLRNFCVPGSGKPQKV
jgi:hypothetical protein